MCVYDRMGHFKFQRQIEKATSACTYASSLIKSHSEGVVLAGCFSVVHEETHFMSSFLNSYFIHEHVCASS